MADAFITRRGGGGATLFPNACSALSDEGRFFGTITVNVPQAIPIEISTASEMTALLVAANVGKVYKFTGTTDGTYTNGDLYEVVTE